MCSALIRWTELGASLASQRLNVGSGYRDKGEKKQDNGGKCVRQSPATIKSQKPISQATMMAKITIASRLLGREHQPAPENSR
jgi:hypothetical protein